MADTTHSYIVAFQEELKLLLSKSIVEVINKLKTTLPTDTDKYNAVVLLESRLNELNLNKIKGIISSDELSLSYNRIRTDLLELIDSFNSEDFSSGKTVKPKKTGKILYQIPGKMKVQEEVKCAIRIAYSDEAIIQNIELTEDTKIESIRISQIMHVGLLDPAAEPVFQIRTYSDKEQFIEKDDYTEWIYYVTALKAGAFPLVLKVSVVEVINNVERIKNIVLEETINITTEAVVHEPVSPYTSGGIAINAAVPAVSPSQAKPSRTIGRPNTKRWLSVVASMLLIFSVSVAVPMIKQEMSWRQANSAHTIESYQDYLQDYPDGKYQEEALFLLAQLQETATSDVSALPEVETTAELPTKKEVEPQPEAYDQPTVNKQDNSSQIENSPLSTDKDLAVTTTEITASPEASTTADALSSKNENEASVSTVVTKPEVIPTREFRTGSFTDSRDEQRYTTVKIKDQVWMAENLNFNMPGSWCYNNESSCGTTGRLYRYGAAIVACPPGWHLPSDEEWKNLALYLGGYNDKGFKNGNPVVSFSKMKHGGLSNFNIQFAGIRDDAGNYQTKGTLSSFWTKTISTQGAAYNYFLSTESHSLFRDNNSKRSNGYSCRCVRD